MRLHHKSIKSFLLFSAIFCFGIWCGTEWRESYFSNTARLSYSMAEISATCELQRNIMFLKTHKTGGTTIQNIILRHAKKHDLFVGLPIGQKFRYNIGIRFKKRFVRPSKHGINILCHHMRFDKTQVASVMPENTKYFTILREPGNIFASFFDYFHHNCRSFKKVSQTNLGLQMWLENVDRYFHGRDSKSDWWYAKNGVAYVLGFNNLRDDATYIEEVITEMENSFELVLIMDYFEESVILLKDFLCLSMSDVQHLHMNSRVNSSIKVDEETRKKIRAWNKIDAALYDHFNKTFWEKVEIYGRNKMSEEIEQLRRINSELADKCIEGQGMVESNLVKDDRFRVFEPNGVRTGGFNLKKDTGDDAFCQDVAQIERAWHAYLLEKQYPDDKYTLMLQ